MTSMEEGKKKFKIVFISLFLLTLRYAIDLASVWVVHTWLAWLDLI